MARSGIQSKTLIDLMDNSDSLVDGVIRKRQFERKFTSLNDFIKWIINFTETGSVEKERNPHESRMSRSYDSGVGGDKRENNKTSNFEK